MATAEKFVVTTEGIHLTLTNREAEVLLKVFRNVGGNGEARENVRGMAGALQSAGVEPAKNVQAGRNLLHSSLRENDSLYLYDKPLTSDDDSGYNEED